jgi:hypothetical protein
MTIRRRLKHQSEYHYQRIRVPWPSADSTMRVGGLAAALLSLVVLFSVSASAARAADEYTGKFEGLAPNTEDTVQVVFRPAGTASGIKFASPPQARAELTVGRLFHPLSGKLSVMAVLVEPKKQDPYIYADIDANGVMDESERFPLKATDNSYIWQATVSETLKDGPFPSFPILVQYYKNTPQRRDG